MSANDTPAPVPRNDLDLSSLQEVLDAQSRALDALKGAALGPMRGQLGQALKLMAQCEGQILVSGGEQAMALARLLAARLSATGSPSFALNPAEALQGNLGMLGRQDIMVMLSDSGESPALAPLIDQVKKRGQPLIALSSAKASALARAADVAIIYPRASSKAKRVSLDNLQLVQMHCLCEALIAGVSQTRIAAPEQLSLLPLLGSLGSQLNYVSDVMLKADRLALVEKDTPLKLVLEAYLAKGCPYVGVLGADGQLSGSIGQENLRMSELLSDSAKTATDIMVNAALCFSPETLAATALHSLSQTGQTAAFVVEGGRPIGLVLLSSLLKAY